MHDPILLYSHVIIGSVGFIAGIVALTTKKGSSIHKRSGWIFVFGISVAVITTGIFMMDEFLPLAIVMSVASVYLMTSSITSIRHQSSTSRMIDSMIIILPIALTVFPAFRLITSLPDITLVSVGQLMISSIFGFCLYYDIKLMINRPTKRNYWIGRHLYRMILAFGFGLMAILRIGVKVEFLDLEITVISPLIFSLLLAYYFKRKQHFISVSHN